MARGTDDCADEAASEGGSKARWSWETADEECSRASGWTCIEEAQMQVIVVGGGLAGMAAATAVLDSGGRVVVLERGPRLSGGSSAKTASSINAAGTRAQKERGISDSGELFAADVMRGGSKKAELVQVLCERSCGDFEWLHALGVEFLALSHLGGHSVPRSHRVKDHRTGYAISKALTQAIEKDGKWSGRSRIITGAHVTRLLTNSHGACRGCVYVKGRVEYEEHGPVVLCTGGFAADFSERSLLAKYRPDLVHLPTASSQFCTGDGLKMAMAIGARTLDLEWVQVHPLGLVRPDDQDAKVKIVAAEALLAAGGIILNQDGFRLCNELGSHDAIVCEMWKSKAPFRLVLNAAAATEVISHCEHYIHRGVMKLIQGGKALARDMGLPVSTLEATHEAHYQAAKAAEKDPDGGPHPGYPLGTSWDEPSGRKGCGKRLFRNAIPGSSVRTEQFYVAVITPVIHYCLGGLEITSGGAVLGHGSETVPGLYAAGEVSGGMHGTSCLGGNALLECIVFGRLAGRASAEYAFCEDLGHPETGGHGQQGDATGAAKEPAAATAPDAPIAADASGQPQSVAPECQLSEIVEAVTDLRKRAAAIQLERFLETRLTAGALQAALADSHARGGSLEAAGEALRSRLCGDADAEPGGPLLKVSMRDFGGLPARVAYAALPDAGSPCAEVPLACVYCRLPLTLEVGRQGMLSLPDAEVNPELTDPEGPYAYTTLLYGSKVEYFLGALVIGWSLKATGTSIDLLLLHTDDVPASFLSVLERFWILRQVQYVEGSQKLYKDYNRSRFKAVFTKLQALSCTDYSKVLMLDLDMLVRSSLDGLFRLRAPAALKRCSGKEQPEHGGTFSAEDMWREHRDDMCSGINAGVMLLRPDQRIYERMLFEIKDHRHPEHIGTYGPEQDYLARFYSTFLTGRWTHLHAKFNYQLMLPADYCSSAHNGLDIQRDVVVAHYSGPRVKPWKLDGDLDASGLARLMYEDQVQMAFGRTAPRYPRNGHGGRAAPPPQSRERVMDGVVVVEDEDQDKLPAVVQAIMWDWVLALRSCERDLKEAGVDLLSVVKDVESFPY